jgi:hypothetical protein
LGAKNSTLVPNDNRAPLPRQTTQALQPRGYAAQQGNVMGFSESLVDEKVDEILRRAAMLMEQQAIHIQELQAGRERSSAQGQLSQTRAMCERLRAYRARFGHYRESVL